MDLTELHDWGIKTSKITKVQFTAWYFLTQVYPPNSRCLQSFFCEAADKVTQSWTLCPGWPGFPVTGENLKTPLRRKDVSSSTTLTGCLQSGAVLSGEAGRWPGMAAGTAVEFADSHPPTMSAMHTAAAWLHYKGASQQHMRWLQCQWLWAVLGLYFTSLFAMALQARARFYGIQSISLNDFCSTLLTRQHISTFRL